MSGQLMLTELGVDDHQIVEGGVAGVGHHVGPGDGITEGDQSARYRSSASTPLVELLDVDVGAGSARLTSLQVTIDSGGMSMVNPPFGSMAVRSGWRVSGRSGVRNDACGLEGTFE